MWTKLDSWLELSWWSILFSCFLEDHCEWHAIMSDVQNDELNSLIRQDWLGFPLVGFSLAGSLIFGVSCLFDLLWSPLLCIVNGCSFSCVATWWLKCSKSQIECSKDIYYIIKSNYQIWKIIPVWIALEKQQYLIPSNELLNKYTAKFLTKIFSKSK